MPGIHTSVDMDDDNKNSGKTNNDVDGEKEGGINEEYGSSVRDNESMFGSYYGDNYVIKTPAFNKMPNYHFDNANRLSSSIPSIPESHQSPIFSAISKHQALSNQKSNNNPSKRFASFSKITRPSKLFTPNKSKSKSSSKKHEMKSSTYHTDTNISYESKHDNDNNNDNNDDDDDITIDETTADESVDDNNEIDDDIDVSPEEINLDDDDDDDVDSTHETDHLKSPPPPPPSKSPSPGIFTSKTMKTMIIHGSVTMQKSE